MNSYRRYCYCVGLISIVFCYCKTATHAQNIEIYRLEECNVTDEDHLHKEGYYLINASHTDAFASLDEYVNWTKHHERDALLTSPYDPTGRIHYLVESEKVIKALKNKKTFGLFRCFNLQEN